VPTRRKPVCSSEPDDAAFRHRAKAENRAERGHSSQDEPFKHDDDDQGRAQERERDAESDDRRDDEAGSARTRKRPRVRGERRSGAATGSST